jgi:hypothetical protein
MRRQVHCICVIQHEDAQCNIEMRQNSYFMFAILLGLHDSSVSSEGKKVQSTQKHDVINQEKFVNRKQGAKILITSEKHSW